VDRDRNELEKHTRPLPPERRKDMSASELAERKTSAQAARKALTESEKTLAQARKTYQGPEEAYKQAVDNAQAVVKDFESHLKAIGEPRQTSKEIFGTNIQHFEKTVEIVHKIFGPLPGEVNVLPRNMYGATRWDQVEQWMAKLKQITLNIPEGRGTREVTVLRSKLFADPKLASIHEVVSSQVEQIVQPELTIYWQYFLDDNKDNWYFGGVGPEILGTIIVALLAMVFALPIGVITAAYLVEVASDNYFVRFIRMCINTLAGVPSVVFGLFGIAFFVLILQPALSLGKEASILAGSLTLAVLVLPVIIRASEEAIRSVPHSYKEASLGLGASQLRTFVTVTLPAAMPGVLTGSILSLSRAAGETAAIMFCCAVAFGAAVPDGLLSPTRVLSFGSYVMATQDETASLVPHKQYGMIMTLVVLVVVMNVGAIKLRSRIARKLRGQ
jgi:phosphate transport system permease protein